MPGRAQAPQVGCVPAGVGAGQEAEQAAAAAAAAVAEAAALTHSPTLAALIVQNHQLLGHVAAMTQRQQALEVATFSIAESLARLHSALGHHELVSAAEGDLAGGSERRGSRVSTSSLSTRTR